MNVLDSELVVGSPPARVSTRPRSNRRRRDSLQYVQCSRACRRENLLMLGRLAGHKRKHPDKVIGVFGCMAQKDQELVRKRAPYVDLVVGTGQLSQIPRLVEEIQRTRIPQYALSLGLAMAGARRLKPVSRASTRCAMPQCDRHLSRRMFAFRSAAISFAPIASFQHARPGTEPAFRRHRGRNSSSGQRGLQRNHLARLDRQ